MSEGPPPQYTYPGLDEKHKILNLMGIFPIEKRRGAICIAALFFYVVIYGYAAPYFGYSGLTVAAVLVPAMLITLFFALCRKNGHYPEWWLYQWIKNLFFRRSVLLFKRRDERNPLKKVRDSVQDALKLNDISWYWIKSTDGVYLLVLRVLPYTISMASPTERRRLWEGAALYYRTIDFPVIELSRNRPGSTKKYQRDTEKSLRAELEATTKPEVSRALKDFGKAHLSFAERITTKYSLYDRSAYLMIPYDPEVEAGMKGPAALYDPKALLSKIDHKVFRRPNAHSTSEEQQRDEEVARTLMMRAELVAGCLDGIGCQVELMEDHELEAFFSSQSRNTEEDPDEPALIHEPVTLEARRFEKLSEKKRRRVIEAAEAYREESPPTVGTAALTIRDNVSPDAVVRNADTTDVNGRPHKTRYIVKLCDFVQLGVLHEIEAMDADMKLLKFIYPKSDQEGARAYGERYSELNAANRTDNDSNTTTRNQKEIARRSTFEAMHAIQNGEAGYVRLSFLIHMEADTHQELEELDFRVFSILQGASIESRITREEAWEGFLTSLPLGRNYITASTEFGLLTPALAGLFSFTTPNLQHEGPDAVMYGLDLSADGQPVIVDDWQMPRPGSLTLGPPDTGKTYLTKTDSTRKRAIGHRVNIIDPAANSYYDAVAEKIGGVHAALAVGSPNKINPFDLHDNYMALSLLTDAIADSVGEEEAERRARNYAIDGKVTALEHVVRMMPGRGRGLTEDEEPTVQRALYRCYEMAGISSDPDTHSKEPPTFSGQRECDFFNVLRAMKAEAEGEDQTEAEVIKGLLRKLRTWDSGTLCELFDSQTTVDVYNKYLVIQVASIDEKAKPAVMAGVMECINGVLSNPDERAHLYADEAHNLLYDDDSASHLENWTRTGRVRNTSVHLISQNTEEFTDTSQGKSIRDNVGTVFVFQQGNQEAAQRLASIYGLSERETEDIHTRLRKGQCYLIAGPSRHKIQVLASDEEDHFFDTSPGAATRRKQRKKVEREEAERLAEAEDKEEGVEIPEAYIPPQEHTTYDTTNGSRPYKAATARAAEHREEPQTSEGDTGEIPVSDGATREIPTTGAYLPALPGEQGEPTRIYAFTGEGSASVAASVAKLLGKEAEVRDLRVLALDAIQTELGEELGVSTSSPDPYLQAADPDDLDGLGNYLTRVEGQGELFYIEGPAATFLSAAPLKEAICKVFDCVVLACPASPTVYSAEWLLAADRVVGCSPEKARSALEAALKAESARGTNGTLLATSAEPADADELEEENDRRELFAALTEDANARLSLATKLITESEEKELQNHE